MNGRIFRSDFHFIDKLPRGQLWRAKDTMKIEDAPEKMAQTQYGAAHNVFIHRIYWRLKEPFSFYVSSFVSSSSFFVQ